MRFTLTVLLLATGLMWPGYSNADSVDVSDGVTVKRSASGLCHPPGSAYFDRVTDNSKDYVEKVLKKTYTSPYKLIDCLNDGGRLPKHLQEARDAYVEAKNARDALATKKADANATPAEVAVAELRAETAAIKEKETAAEAGVNSAGKKENYTDFGGAPFRIGYWDIFSGSADRRSGSG